MSERIRARSNQQPREPAKDQGHAHRGISSGSSPGPTRDICLNRHSPPPTCGSHVQPHPPPHADHTYSQRTPKLKVAPRAVLLRRPHPHRRLITVTPAPTVDMLINRVTQSRRTRDPPYPHTPQLRPGQRIMIGGALAVLALGGGAITAGTAGAAPAPAPAPAARGHPPRSTRGN